MKRPTSNTSTIKRPTSRASSAAARGGAEKIGDGGFGARPTSTAAAHFNTEDHRPSTISDKESRENNLRKAYEYKARQEAYLERSSKSMKKFNNSAKAKPTHPPTSIAPKASHVTLPDVPADIPDALRLFLKARRLGSPDKGGSSR
jgi:hypothetical protein